jgi:DnaK suppressor protein
MARRDALLRLHKTLLARREHLRAKLAGELANLREFRAADSAGDSADAAFEAGGDEMSSQLAQLDDRELSHIERALARLQLGTYGTCEGGSANCQKRIPVARLNALPYTPFCIHCERDQERHLDRLGRGTRGKWGLISDGEGPMQDKGMNVTEIEMKLLGSRRG